MKKVKTGRINWKKVDPTEYQNHVTDKLSEIDQDILQTDLNKATTIINTVMVDSAKLCVPEVKTKHSQKSKLKVNNSVIQAAIYDKKTVFFFFQLKTTRPPK